MTFMALNIKRIVTLLLPMPEYALYKTGFG